MKFVPIKFWISAKAADLSHQSPATYVVEVPVAANKTEIAAAVGTAYKVKVVRVRTLRQKGKPASSRQLTRRARQHRPSLAGRRSGFKKAYVTLAAGDKIPVFGSGADSSKKS